MESSDEIAAHHSFSSVALAGYVGCAVGGRGNLDSVADARHIGDSAVVWGEFFAKVR